MGLQASAAQSHLLSEPAMTAAFDFDVPPFDTLNTAQQALVRATASVVHFAADDPLLVSGRQALWLVWNTTADGLRTLRVQP